METFSAWLAICAGNSLVNSPHKGQWRGAWMFSLIWTWTDGWISNGDAGDLRRHDAHYDVIVMCRRCYNKLLNRFMSLSVLRVSSIRLDQQCNSLYLHVYHCHRVVHDVTYINLVITDSDYGLLRYHHQTIARTNVGLSVEQSLWQRVWYYIFESN